MMWWYGYGTPGWGMALMLLGSLVVVALVTLAVAAFLRSGRAAPGGDADRILRERLARGEIDLDEFRAVKDALDEPRSRT